MRAEKEVRELMEKVLGLVTAPEAVVTYAEDRVIATRFGNNAITQNKSGGDSSLSLSVARGTRHGGSATNRLDEGGLRELVERAEGVAADCPEDPEYVPPAEPCEYPTIAQPFYESTERTDPEDVAGMIGTCVEKAAAMKMRAAGTFEATTFARAIANSNGLYCYDNGTFAEFGMTVHTGEGTGKASACSENIARIDAGALADEAIATADANRGQADPEPGDYTVVLSPYAVSELLEFLFFDLDAREADEGVNAFAGRVGSKLFDERVRIYSPLDDPEAPPPLFGDGGLPARETVWIESGRLERLRHNRFWAQEKGTEPDPHMFPVKMDGEDRGFDELVAMCDKGLLVNRLWYIRYVDQREMLLTGMTRDGTFLIENGKVAGPVKNMRFNESPLVVLGNVRAMSRAMRASPYAKVPGLLIDGFTMSSTTEF
jgi:predicted Zn-dependent protease